MRHRRRLSTILLLLACAPLLAGCKVALDHHLNERQSNAIVALLLDHGIPASKSLDKTGNYIVNVEQHDFAAAYALQRDHGLPRAAASTAQLFNGSGLVASPQADAAKLVFAEDQQIADAISSIDGVIGAHVIIVPPQFDPLSENKSLSAASVLVNYARGAGVTRLVPQIKMLVADGVRGLSYDRVTVVMVPGTGASITGKPEVAPLENVAGIWVAAGSGWAVKLLLAVAVAAIAGVLGLGGILGWRRRDSLIAQGGKLLLPIRR